MKRWHYRAKERGRLTYRPRPANAATLVATSPLGYDPRPQTEGVGRSQCTASGAELTNGIDHARQLPRHWLVAHLRQGR